jgi:hypothetical protein
VLAATLLPCAALPLQASTTHAQAHKATATHPTAHGHATTAHTVSHPSKATPSKHHQEIARAPTKASHALHRKPVAIASAHLSPREALAAKAAAYRNVAPTIAATKPIEPTPSTAEDAGVDRATQDRVHAWMRAHSAAAAQPDLSRSPRKATADDFDRAAQRQTQTLHAVAAQNQARTTTADDDAAAMAESQIPSTAPTSRVPTPFTHGELLGSATSADFTAKADSFTPQPATLTTKPSNAATLKQPDTRTDAAALANTVSTTPKLQLPRPVTIAHNAPATSAITAAAKHPVLDTAVTAGMSDDTFDTDAPTPTAATAINLASKTPKPDFIAKPAITVNNVETRNLAKVDLYDARGHLLIIPAMKGSHEILVHQNQMAIADGLDRIDDDDQLYDMRRLKLLVALPDNDAIEVNESLPPNRRFARPWSVRFLNDLSRAHYARFHTPLVITSAVRTVAFQRRLMLTNGNAAPPTGDVASPHLYGQAVDLGKHGMSITEIAWMRAYLTPIENEGKIDVEEEFQQACFHISVYRRYLGLPARKTAARPDIATSRTVLQAKATPPAKRHRLPSALLATGLR